MVFSAWTTPRNWATDELVTASLLNTHIRDNLNALKNPPANSYANTGNYSTTSTSWVDVDSSNMSLTVTTNGGSVIVCAETSISVTGTDYTANLKFDLDVNDTLIERVREHYRKGGNGTDRTICCMVWRVLLDAGENEIALQWKIGGTASIAYIYGIDFWVQEVS